MRSVAIERRVALRGEAAICQALREANALRYSRGSGSDPHSLYKPQHSYSQHDYDQDGNYQAQIVAAVHVFLLFTCFLWCWTREAEQANEPLSSTSTPFLPKSPESDEKF